MALGAVLTGNARASDGTAVIYDLSTLGPNAASKPGDKGPPGHDDPSDHDRRDWGHGHGHDGDHDRGPGHGHGHDGDHDRGRGHGHGHDGDGDPGGQREGNPSPTPEPGTMLLLGGALAAGARRFRKR